MYKRILLVIVMVFSILTGCGEVKSPTNTLQQNGQSPLVTDTPNNIKNIEGFSPIESQSFLVNLNSWGKVKFVSGKLTAGNHIPVVFYLTNENGDILYDFNVTLPYSVDVKAVSFEDLNKDGLKDILIIVDDNYDGSGTKIATVYFQKDNGTFSNDPKLDKEINARGKNKDIKTVTNYLPQVIGKYNINSNEKGSKNEAMSTPFILKDSSETSNNLEYSNTKMGLTLTFPESWKGKYFIEEQEKGITVVHNSLIERKGVFFSISIFGDEAKWNEWLKTEKDGWPFKKLGVRNGLVYVKSCPSDSQYENSNAQQKASEEYLNMSKQIDLIVSTFKFIKK